MNYVEHINKGVKDWTKGPRYTRIAPGVYVDSKTTYRAKKTINGKEYSKSFTNKRAAIKWYKTFTVFYPNYGF